MLKDTSWEAQRYHRPSSLVSLQVMKMLMALLTPATGKINFQLPEGAVLSAGDLIAVLDLDDPAAVTAAAPYPGGFPELGPPLVHSQGVDYRFKEAYSAAKMILEGMCKPNLQPFALLFCNLVISCGHGSVHGYRIYPSSACDLSGACLTHATDMLHEQAKFV